MAITAEMVDSIKTLKEKGHIDYMPNRARTIVLL